MALKDLLAKLKDTENPITDMEAFILEVSTAHDEEIGVRDAKVNTTLAEKLEMEDKMTKLKVHNYDLIQKIPVAKPDTDADKPETKVSGVDSFFEE